MLFQEISEQRFEYIKRLKQCIKWFQQLEGNYNTEQEKLNNLLELAEKQFNEMGMIDFHLCLQRYNVSCFVGNKKEKEICRIANLCRSLYVLSDSLMKAKEEELNSIIMELRKNLDALQDKFTKEESDKLVRSTLTSQLLVCSFWKLLC